MISSRGSVRLSRMESDLSNFQGKHVLITGGLGFIGSTLAIQLLNLDAKVTLIDSLEPNYGGHLTNIEGYQNDLTVVVDDVRNTAAIQKLIKNQDFLLDDAVKSLSYSPGLSRRSRGGLVRGKRILVIGFSPNGQPHSMLARFQAWRSKTKSY